MRFRTLEIRWHDSKPISTCDFQPVSFKKARPPVGQEQNFAGQSYRLATGGEDNHVRVRLVVYPSGRARCFDETELEFEDMDGTSKYHAG
jgi:chromatin assembly factor 1 subunit B